MNINVAIADDQKLFRKGMAALIGSFDKMSLQFEAENGLELLDLCKAAKNCPDVVLLDLSMPELNGLETLKLLKERYPAIKVIILTIHEAESFILTTVQAGANGYLAKNAEPDEVETAIREVVRNDFYFTPAMLSVMRKGLSMRPQHLALNNEDNLTAREREVLQLICRQYSNAEIAERLYISARTVEGHRNSIMIKSESRNTAGIVIYALKHKLLDLDVLL